MNASHTVEIVEVGPRDGLQGIRPFVATPLKQSLIAAAAEAGLMRIEIGSLVSEKAVPQLRDTPELIERFRGSSFATQVLVPTKSRGERAGEAGASWIAYVISVRESHNLANLKRSVEVSVADYLELTGALSDQTKLRLNVATAFDCPFEGKTSMKPLMQLIGACSGARADVEVCLCDTTGRGNPIQIGEAFRLAMQEFPSVASWALHGHDTYGLGLSNVYAAYTQGVRVFDAAFGGLGGCPFAPGATGNVATEDVAYLFEGMGVSTGLSLDKLVALAEVAVGIPEAVVGGRVREAIRNAGRTCS